MCGIWTFSSNNIYLNNFIDNCDNVYSEATNIWNSPEKITYTYKGGAYTNYLGNYWSDYTGSDADGDGIGDTFYDTSYSIDSDKDNYPLMQPWENYFKPAKNKLPSASFTFSPSHPFVGQLVTLDAFNSIDPDGVIEKYEWDFGDGERGEGKIIIHSYSSVGNYDVTLTVTDDDGATNSTSKTITVEAYVPPPMKAGVFYNTLFYGDYYFALDLKNLLETQGFTVIFGEMNESLIRNTVRDPDTKILRMAWHGTDYKIKTISGYYTTYEMESDLANRDGLTIAGIFCCGEQVNSPGHWLFTTRKGSPYYVSMRCNAFMANGTLCVGQWLDDNESLPGACYGTGTQYYSILERMGEGMTISDAIQDAWGTYHWVKGVGRCAFGKHGGWSGDRGLRYPQYIGDFNYDNVFNELDRDLLRHYLDNNIEIPVERNWSADVNGDGKVNYADIAVMNSMLSEDFNDVYPRGWVVRVDTTPPSSISNLTSTTGTTWINWTWTNPPDVDFNYTMVYLNGTWITNSSNEYYNATGLIPNTSYTISIRTVDKVGNVNMTWVNQTAKTRVENTPPIAFFTYLPEKPVINQTITFDASSSYDPDGNIMNYKWDFGDGNITNTTEEKLKHSYSEAGIYEVTLTVTDNEGATNSAAKVITVYSSGAIFDCGEPKNPYPSIMGTHNGTITTNKTIIATKLYTYPCEGTGGHTEYVRIWNKTWNVTATWKGYAGDWHNITFDNSVVLLANKTYNYTIRTGSYPQIHHNKTLTVPDGEITCTKFIDANGRVYYDWIPAIRLWAG